MLDEWCVIGAAAQVADRNIVVHMRVSVAVVLVEPIVDVVWIFRLGLALLPLVVHGAALWAGNFLGDIANEFLERGYGAGVEIRAGNTDIRIEVRHSVLQLFRMALCPLG